MVAAAVEVAASAIPLAEVPAWVARAGSEQVAPWSADAPPYPSGAVAFVAVERVELGAEMPGPKTESPGQAWVVLMVPALRCAAWVAEGPALLFEQAWLVVPGLAEAAAGARAEPEAPPSVAEATAEEAAEEAAVAAATAAVLAAALLVAVAG